MSSGSVQAQPSSNTESPTWASAGAVSGGISRLGFHRFPLVSTFEGIETALYHQPGHLPEPELTNSADKAYLLPCRKEQGVLDNSDAISQYTSKQAIEDGILVDVMERAEGCGLKCPAGLT